METLALLAGKGPTLHRHAQTPEKDGPNDLINPF